MTFLIFMSNSLALWVVRSMLLYNVCAFLELTCAYIKVNSLGVNKVKGKMKLKISTREEKVKVMISIHHLFLDSFEFTVQMAQFFFQAVQFGPVA